MYLWCSEVGVEETQDQHLLPLLLTHETTLFICLNSPSHEVLINYHIWTKQYTNGNIYIYTYTYITHTCQNSLASTKVQTFT